MCSQPNGRSHSAACEQEDPGDRTELLSMCGHQQKDTLGGLSEKESKEQQGAP